jgi:integrase
MPISRNHLLAFCGNTGERKSTKMEITLKEQLFKGEGNADELLPVRIRIRVPGENEVARETGPELTSSVFEKTKTNTTTAFTNPAGLDPVSQAKSKIETAKKRIEAIARVLKEQNRLSGKNIGKVIDHATFFKRKEREQFKHLLSDPLKPFDAVAAVNAALGTVQGSTEQAAIIAEEPVVAEQPFIATTAPQTGSQQSPAAYNNSLLAPIKDKQRSVSFGGSAKTKVTFRDVRDLMTNHTEYAQESFWMMQYRDNIRKAPDGNLELSGVELLPYANFIAYARWKINQNKKGVSEDREEDCHGIIDVLVKFLEYKGLVPENDPDPYRAFLDFDKPFFEAFDDWMMNFSGEINGLKKKKYTRATASMYLSTIRSYFHAAEDEEEIINRKLNPFRGKNKFSIPTPEEIDRNIPPEVLAKLLAYTPERKKSSKWGSEEEAMDFLKMSLRACGMNIMDLLSLKDAHIEKESFTFRRAKIEKRKKGAGLKVTVQLWPSLRKLMEKYKKPVGVDTEYYFPHLILTEKEKEELANVQPDPDPQLGITKEIAYQRRFNKIIRRKVTVFVNRIDRWLKRICEKLGIELNITIYWARHTFANMAINGGIPETRVGQAMGQRNVKSLDRYKTGKMNKENMQKMANLIDETIKHIKVEVINEEINEDEINLAPAA